MLLEWLIDAERYRQHHERNINLKCNTMQEQLKKELQKKELFNTYGGSTIYVTYLVTHQKNGFTNTYDVVFELRVSASELDTYLVLSEVKAHDNNEETLITEGIENLLEI